MLRKSLITFASVFMITTAAPRPAAADWLFTPFIGSTFGGSADVAGAIPSSKSDFERKLNWGASLTGGGPAGFELDFGYSPNFFENTAGGDDFAFGDNNVTTLMANLKVGAPFGGQHGGGIRPYASGGVGLIKARIDDPDDIFNVNSTDWGFNVGAGVAGFFSNNVGLQGDVRYFRSLQDNEPDDEFDVALGSFDFWRGTVGVTFRW